MKITKKKILLFIETLIAVLFLAGALYVSDFYAADTASIQTFLSEQATPKTQTDQSIIYLPENAESAIIFYPGGKVEALAYKPLMAALAQQNIASFLMEMPFNLAVFNINAADGIQAHYPQIQKWYMAGHSLGGVMAASYLAEHLDDYDGLILLASYSTSDFSKTDLNVLSIYGTEDKILNLEQYTQCRSNLPESFVEVILDGANHAQFGMYGLQDKDGIASISNEQQIHLTAEQISAFLQKK